MITKSIDYYEFKELSPEVQKKVISKHISINIDNDYWYEGILEDFICKAREKGFKITSKDIKFDIGDGQGSGACFDCTNIDLDKIILNFSEKLQKRYNLYCRGYSLEFHTATNSFSNSYCHKNTRYIDFNYNDSYCSRINVIINSVSKNILSYIVITYDGLCNELYHDLISYYDTLMSDTEIINTFNYSGMYFTKNGNDYIII